MRLILLFLFGLTAFHSVAQKKYTSERINEKIVVDGKLEETSWLNARVAGGFTQIEPDPGEAPSQKTSVKILYDDDAIYVGATMHDTNPDLILTELAIRDQGSNSDNFAIVFDTYKDGINGFAFIVSAAGVQSDLKWTAQGEDSSWDAVWESEVTIHEGGWTAEFKIPYNAVRFPATEQQVWGLQMVRQIRRYRENVSWNPVDPAINGFVNQSGVMDGINNIETPIRLALTPYVTGYLNSSFIPNESGSSETGTTYTTGMDLKYGINDAFTLDMTLIPDFGQTISDQQVLNLGPFEVFFEENRQFFTEGIELFNKGNLFYTRRVGGRPLKQGMVQGQLDDGEFIKSNPSTTRLINATKISGRTNKGLGVGFFNAISNKESAVIGSISGRERLVETNPLTNYNVIVLDQNLPNNSFASLVNTNVLRFGSDYDANVTGGFFDIKNKDQTYGIGGRAVVSNQAFETYNNTGFSYRLNGGRISGPWTYGMQYSVESDNYDINDMGFLFSPNERNTFVDIDFNQYDPKDDKVALYRIGGFVSYERLYFPSEFTNLALGLNAFKLFKSRLAYGANLRFRPIDAFDYFEPRTSDFSRYMRIPDNYGGSAFVSSDYRKPFAYDVRVRGNVWNEEGRHDMGITIAPRIRFNDKLSLFTTTNIDQSNLNYGFVNKQAVNSEIYNFDDSDILMGRRNISTIENEIRTRYIFNNKMGVNMVLRHYWAKVKYQSFGLLDNNGRLEDINFEGSNLGGEPIFDNNYNVFNIDLQYQWRFAPGSDIFVVWKNSIQDFSIDNLDRNYFTNVNGLFDARQDNSISVRVVYFLDYESIKG